MVSVQAEVAVFISVAEPLREDVKLEASDLKLEAAVIFPSSSNCSEQFKLL